MGRLTLNVLLSFAQFEREVTGERIRDKIAASKAKGMWMGGTLPLGYDPPTDTARTLVLNEAEAETVRLIFTTYLRLKSAHALQHWLQDKGIRSKRRVTAKGRILGDKDFSRGALFHLLRNKTYLGLAVHKDKTYPANHPAIIDQALFDKVQRVLVGNARRAGATAKHGNRSLLTGRIFNADGAPMSPTFTHGSRGQVYRYYVSAPLQRGAQKSELGPCLHRVSAQALEAMVSQIVGRLLPNQNDERFSIVKRIELHDGTLHLLMPVKHLSAVRARLEPGDELQRDEGHPSLLTVIVPAQFQVRGGRTTIIGGAPHRARRDPVLIRALRAAHAMVASDDQGLPVLHASPDSPYLRRLVRLAFLAPDLQRAILDGRQNPELSLKQLMRLPCPTLWSEQQRIIEASN